MRQATRRAGFIIPLRALAPPTVGRLSTYSARLKGVNRVVVNPAVIKEIQKKFLDVHQAATETAAN
jgi:hypothetical protein